MIGYNSMMEYSLLIFAALAFLMACNEQFDNKYGAEWTELTLVPKDSAWRKMYPFKDKENNPLLYVKLIPFFVTFFVLIAVFIVYIVYWISPSLLSYFLGSKWGFIIPMIYFLVVFIYYMILEIDFKW